MQKPILNNKQLKARYKKAKRRFERNRPEPHNRMFKDVEKGRYFRTTFQEGGKLYDAIASIPSTPAQKAKVVKILSVF